MNKHRRMAISLLIDRINENIAEAESLRDEEQDYYDNMPESLQGGEKGELAESAISSLDSAIDNLNEAVSSLEESQQ